jgi:hypothetical protein
VEKEEAQHESAARKLQDDQDQMLGQVEKSKSGGCRRRTEVANAEDAEAVLKEQVANANSVASVAKQLAESEKELATSKGKQVASELTLEEKAEMDEKC